MTEKLISLQASTRHDFARCVYYIIPKIPDIM
jgi:hypothetical protein